MQRGINLQQILFGVYAIVGLYFINMFFNFVTIPTAFTSSDIGKLIPAIGGIMLILSGLNFLRKKNYYPPR